VILSLAAIQTAKALGRNKLETGGSKGWCRSVRIAGRWHALDQGQETQAIRQWRASNSHSHDAH
jgi:hypothetical protein